MNDVVLSNQSHVSSGDLLQLEACKPLSHSNPPIPPAALVIVTPLIPHHWEDALRHHPDQQLASYVVSGLTNGFRVGYQRAGSTKQSARINMVSAVRNPGPVQQYLSTELTEGRIAGPSVSRMCRRYM